MRPSPDRCMHLSELLRYRAGGVIECALESSYASVSGGVMRFVGLPDMGQCWIEL
jgi:hypothetical protein